MGSEITFGNSIYEWNKNLKKKFEREKNLKKDENWWKMFKVCFSKRYQLKEKQNFVVLLCWYWNLVCFNWKYCEEKEIFLRIKQRAKQEIKE